MNGAYGLNGSLSIIWACFELHLEDLIPGSEKNLKRKSGFNLI